MSKDKNKETYWVDVRVNKNIGNNRIYMLTYDISENHVAQEKKETNWEEVFATLVSSNRIKIDKGHLFHIEDNWNVYAIRPAESTWIFFSLYSLESLDRALSQFQDKGLLYGISEIKVQEDGIVTSLHLEKEQQEYFDDWIDWQLENNDDFGQ